MQKMTFRRQSTKKDNTQYTHLEEGTMAQKAFVPGSDPVIPMSTALADDDDPTIFTSFMTLYLGFFGLTMLVYPYIHSSSDSPWNPMAYTTKLSEETAFAFRIAGSGFLTLVIGPYLDEIFGGVGVQMKAFTRQMLFANGISFVLFTYFTFYDPVPTAIPLMWKAQTIMSGFLLVWSVVEAIPLGFLPGAYVGFNLLMYTGFGLTLTAKPDLFYGPPSPVAYWNTWGDFAILSGRSLGMSLLILVTVGTLYANGPGFAKQLTVFNAFNLGLFALPAFYGGASAVTTMWMIQFVLGVVVLLVGLYLELAGATGKWGPEATCCEKCGANVEAFNLFNLFFYIPFVLGFYYDPNLMFGPNGLMPPGMSMFTADLNETSIWFCRAWATNMLMLVLGPYLFGLSPVKVAKQMVISYLAYTCLFTYILLTTDLFNMMVMGPLTGLNVIFLIWGIVSVTGKESLLAI